MSEKYFVKENKLWISAATAVGFLCGFMWYFGFKSQMGFLLVGVAVALLALFVLFKQIHFPPSGFVVFIASILVLGAVVAYGTQPTPTKVFVYSAPLSSISTKTATLRIVTQQSGNVVVRFSQSSSLAYAIYFSLPQFNYIFNFNAYTNFAAHKVSSNETLLNATSTAADIEALLGTGIAWTIIIQTNTGQVNLNIPQGSNVSAIAVNTKVGGVFAQVRSAVPSIGVTTTTGDVTMVYSVSKANSSMSYSVRTTTGSITTNSSLPTAFALHFQAATIKGKINFLPQSMWLQQTGTSFGGVTGVTQNFGNSTYTMSADLKSVLGNISSAIIS